MNNKSAHVLDNLHFFVDAGSRKNALKRLLWLYENDLGTSAEIAKANPELNDVVKQIAQIYKNELEPVLVGLYPLVRAVEKVSPKY